VKRKRDERKPSNLEETVLEAETLHLSKPATQEWCEKGAQILGFQRSAKAVPERLWSRIEVDVEGFFAMCFIICSGSPASVSLAGSVQECVEQAWLAGRLVLGQKSLTSYLQI
jgi:hypothetical protein